MYISSTRYRSGVEAHRKKRKINSIISELLFKLNNFAQFQSFKIWLKTMLVSITVSVLISFYYRQIVYTLTVRNEFEIL